MKLDNQELEKKNTFKKKLILTVKYNKDELKAININGTLYRGKRLENALKRLESGFDLNTTPFWAWGKKYVYFSVIHDGVEWIEDVPRYPSRELPVFCGVE